MKIAYIITRANQYGGAQIHVRDLSLWMKNNGHEVAVLAGKSGIVSDKIIENGVPFYAVKDMTRAINLRRDFKAFLQTRSILKKLKPDIVSCHSSKAGIIGRMAAWTLGIPVIFTAHGWAFNQGMSTIKPYLYVFIERFFSLLSSHIITVSRHGKFFALSKNITSPEKITAIHNGMPFIKTPHNRVPNLVPQLVMVARFAAPKDHVTLLNALASIQDKPWHLNLVGGGDDTPYKALAQSLDIQNRVTFHGQRTDIEDYLLTQDIFLLISDSEGFPRSIIEAMRASLPVITTRVGGSAESVSQFQSGYIIPRANIARLATAITKLIDDPILRKTMGDIGRQRYERYFTFDTMAQKTLNVYETVLNLEISKQIATQEQARLVSD